MLLFVLTAFGYCELASTFNVLTWCSDPTRMDQASVHQCHPWIGNADTHSTRGFITE